MNDLQAIRTAIAKAETIGLMSHTSPDGDSLGSLLAFMLGICQIHPHVAAIKTDLVPKYLDFLPCANEMVSLEDKRSYDLLFVLDCGDPQRAGPGLSSIEEAKVVINIDHHISNTHFGTINLVDSAASSTSEIIYRLLTALQVDITVPMATLLYAGILTDSGRFLYENSSADTMRICADLIDLGVDKEYINRKLYQSNDLKSVMVNTEIIMDSDFLYGNKVVLSYAPLSKTLAQAVPIESTEEVVNFFRDIDGVELSCLIKQKTDQEYKISFRSKNQVDVSIIATDLGGGGHKRAAGCTIHGTEQVVRQILMDKLNQIKWE